MEITDVEKFLIYYSKVKKRTKRLFAYIPPEKIEWTYQEGKFTLGDIIRHLANIERHMYAENAQFKPSLYDGCGVEYAMGYDNVIEYYQKMEVESFEIFAKVPNEDLVKKTTNPGGIQITLWKWWRLMVEHEIHHRGQIYTYLGLLNIDVPPLYGLTSEEVIKRKGII